MSEPFALSLTRNLATLQRKPQRVPQLSFHHDSPVQHLHYCWWLVNKFPRYLNSLAWGSLFPPTHKNHGLRLGDSHSSWLSCSKVNILVHMIFIIFSLSKGNLTTLVHAEGHILLRPIELHHRQKNMDDASALCFTGVSWSVLNPQTSSMVGSHGV